jgi:NTP pyrophosphatase (non-canonical NTP hydrolase)
MPESMNSPSLSAIQQRLKEFDSERGWDAVQPVHTALHLMEEIGEVARELLVIAGYKTPDGNAKGRLEGELADVTLLLFKLASQHGIDLERAVLEKLDANDARFPLEAAQAAMVVYMDHQLEES